MLGPICVEQQISDPFIQLIQEVYIYPKKRASNLTKSCSIAFEQSFTRAVGRFDIIIGFIYVLLDFSVCVCWQKVSGSISKSNLSQNKWEKDDLSKRTQIYDNRKRWLSVCVCACVCVCVGRGGGREILEIRRMFAGSIVF